MKILFATTVLPHEQTTGGEIASQNFIDAMRLTGHQVSVFGFARPGMAVPQGSTSIDCRPIETQARPWFAVRTLFAALLGGRPFICQKFHAKNYVRHLRAAAKRGLADLLVIDHAQMGWLLPLASTLARRRVFIAHNHEAALYAEQANRHSHPFRRAIVRRDARLIGIVEKQLARSVDQVWTLSAAECRVFDTLAGRTTSTLMPLPGRMPCWPIESIKKRVDVALLGTWAWPVNGQGLDWFVDEVLPCLPQNVSIAVGGRGSEKINGRRVSLSGIGLVEDATQFLLAAKVVAVPSVLGAGIQLKTIEAITLGLPTVSTTIGLRGIDPVPEYVRTADDPRDFAQALLAGLSQELDNADAGRRWAQQRGQAFERAVACRLEQLKPRAARPLMAVP